MRSKVIILVLILATGVLAEEKPALQLDVYSWLTKGSKSGKEGAGRYTLEVHSVVTNVSDKPLTLPTSNGTGEPDYLTHGGDEIEFGFELSTLRIDGKPLVLSPYRYYPVTLQPGECTELPMIEADVSERKILQIHFSVDQKFAAQQGWWWGHLMKKAVIGEGNEPYLGRSAPGIGIPSETKRPNHAPQPTRADGPRG